MLLLFYLQAAVVPVPRGPSTTLSTGLRSLPHPGNVASSVAEHSIRTPQYAAGSSNVHPYSAQSGRWLTDSEAMGRPLTCSNESARDLGFEAPTFVDCRLTQAASRARDTAQPRLVSAKSAWMTSFIQDFMSAQVNNISAVRLMEETTGGFGLSSAGGARKSVVAP